MQVSMQKRLGDSFPEQNFVREEMATEECSKNKYLIQSNGI
jgi:hypothetical protein